MSHSKSEILFGRAKESIPGGVNSPVRSFNSVGGSPVFIKNAKGAYLYDVDGNKYIDMIASWGPMILGHADKKVINAIKKAVKNSTSYGAPTLLEIQMAELIKSMCPNIDMVRMVSSGTEACMSALRLARGYTNKNKFIKFEGHYHGHADAFLVSAGSGLATLGIQSAPGLTTGTTKDTLIAKYNDMASVQKLVSENMGEIAAIILEPVAGNMGCIPPNKDFLQSLRKICDEENIVLIFDEVMTGFRLAPGGAQEIYGVQADLVTFGKVIGGGMPVGAFGGKRAIMSQIAPIGKVYQAGTLSGNPISMTAGITTLKTLKENPSIYKSIADKTAYLHKGLRNAFCAYEISATINRVGSMISVHFAEHPVINFKDASSCDIGMFNKYFHFLLKKGVYLPPSAFESWFLNDALSYKDLDKVIKYTEQFAKNNKKK